MTKGKSMGIDGFNTNFFHHCWETIKNKVWEVVEESQNRGYMHPPLKSTFISFIPKSDYPYTLGEFKTTSLCDITYKVVEKIIARWLKMDLSKIISHEQFGFMEGMKIHEEIGSLKKEFTL